MSGWKRVADELPPLDIPVWLWLPSIGQAIIGTLEDVGEGWLWGSCWGSFWYADGGWHTDTSESDDYKPSHWMPLPEPPGATP